VIAAEINMINYQTGKILLYSAVEIGRRLKEAKALLPHGEWGKWLDEAVSFSRSTATRLIQVYEKYGPKLLAASDGDDSGDGSSNRATLHDLTYSQALTLLGLPAEEREAFITENDVGSMSTRELSQAIADRDRALEEKNQALQEKEGLQIELNNKNSAMDGLATQIQALEKQTEAYKQKYEAEQDKVTSKQKELEEAKAGNASAEKVEALAKNLKTGSACCDRVPG